MVAHGCGGGDYVCVLAGLQNARHCVSTTIQIQGCFADGWRGHATLPTLGVFLCQHQGVECQHRRGMFLIGGILHSLAGTHHQQATTPTVSFTPDTWTSQAKGAVSWKGLSDELSNFRVEYRIDQGSYINLNKPNAGAGTVDTIDLKNLSEGTHTISIRGVDSVGNAGKEGTATIYIDRNGPTLSKDLTVEPADWTNLNTIKIQWFGAADKYSGLNKIAYAVDNGAFTDTTTSVNGPTDISVSGVSEGEHLARLKLTDKAGNARAYSAWFKIDRSAPTIGKVNADPATWTAQKELQLIWENAADQYSGLNSIKYAVDKGQQLDAALLASGWAKVNVSALTEEGSTKRKGAS